MALENNVMAVIRASRPSFRNSHNKIALAVHASFVAFGRLLTMVGESDIEDSALSLSSTGEVYPSICIHFTIHGVFLFGGFISDFWDF
uniref:Uncharacterized protein n=1 Tax=Kalanchoe fedtschenkoi TaxID=63787 RepID=A0A7N0ZWE5_KALFE